MTKKEKFKYQNALGILEELRIYGNPDQKGKDLTLREKTFLNLFGKLTGDLQMIWIEFYRTGKKVKALRKLGNILAKFDKILGEETTNDKRK